MRMGLAETQTFNQLYSVLAQLLLYALYSMMCTSQLSLPLLPIPPLPRPSALPFALSGTYPARHILGYPVLACVSKCGFGLTMHEMPASFHGMVMRLVC
jgi:hypothetical protein